jgi:hypothetical protein
MICRPATRCVLLPSVLALLGLWMLVGCFYIPGRDKMLGGGANPRTLVGGAKSDRPLRVGVATRDDVHDTLGLPTQVAAGGRYWVYRWGTQSGSWLMPLCFTAEPAWRRYRMWLEFADTGRLTRFGLESDVEEFNPLGGGRPSPEKTVDAAATRPVGLNAPE